MRKYRHNISANQLHWNDLFVVDSDIYKKLHYVFDKSEVAILSGTYAVRLSLEECKQIDNYWEEISKFLNIDAEKAKCSKAAIKKEAKEILKLIDQISQEKGLSWLL